VEVVQHGLALGRGARGCPPPPPCTTNGLQAQFSVDAPLEDVIFKTGRPDKMNAYVSELQGNGLDATVATWWGMTDEERKEFFSPALRFHLKGVLMGTERGTCIPVCACMCMC
jgi:hypothetical protein